jgi:hypothetical protein
LTISGVVLKDLPELSCTALRYSTTNPTLKMLANLAL